MSCEMNEYGGEAWQWCKPSPRMDELLRFYSLRSKRQQFSLNQISDEDLCRILLEAMKEGLNQIMIFRYRAFKGGHLSLDIVSDPLLLRT